MTRIKCCESIFLKVPEVTEKRYFFLIGRNSRKTSGSRGTRTTKPRTARTLSERGKWELFRQHRNLGHPQPTELARALRHAGARREAVRFVLKELRCPTCEARPLPLPPHPGMLPRCLLFYCAVQATGLARHRSQPRENINAGTRPWCGATTF